jgi:hypothetical protein
VLASPMFKKKGGKKVDIPHVPSTSKLTVQGSGQPGQQQQKPQIENTVFVLPGVDIKVGCGFLRIERSLKHILNGSFRSF